MISDVEPIFMSVGHLYVLFGEVFIQVFCSFLNWVVCFFGVVFCKYFVNFDINPLSDVSNSVGCLLFF